VYASDQVDVDRRGHDRPQSAAVIGAVYTTDSQHVHYFDPDYQKLHEMISKALPKSPLIDFHQCQRGRTAAGGARQRRHRPRQLVPLRSEEEVAGNHFPVSPGAQGKDLAQVKTISYAAADGTQIPAYLTLPPGVTEAKNLPAIVLPHGGPGARDEWGFDWLSQYFAQRGYVVLQPNFRGFRWLRRRLVRQQRLPRLEDLGRRRVRRGALADFAGHGRMRRNFGVFGWSYGGLRRAAGATCLRPTCSRPRSRGAGYRPRSAQEQGIAGLCQRVPRRPTSSAAACT
jgi:dipeptidyl aminopeptidase/acylaminoacyl peptidase